MPHKILQNRYKLIKPTFTVYRRYVRLFKKTRYKSEKKYIYNRSPKLLAPRYHGESALILQP